MVRPRKCRRVNFNPEITYFKPQGVPLRILQEVVLTKDELECLRLSELENLSQIQSAELMEIHQSTFQRTLAKAREKITDALVNGKAIKIHGGEIMPGGDKTGPQGKGPKTGRGLGYCSGSDKPGFESEEPTQGLGLNNGNNRGCRRRN
ncbi:MAG: DUF134 domain-containing protein [Candidatus Woesearchaeota archaeon]